MDNESDLQFRRFKHNDPVPSCVVYLKSNPKARLILETDMIPLYKKEFGQTIILDYCQDTLRLCQEMGITECAANVVASDLAGYKDARES